MLEDEKLGRIGFYPEDEAITTNKPMIDNMKENFYKFSKFYKQKVDYITQPFSEAIIKSMGSLIRDDVWNNMGEEYGTILNMGFPFKGVSVMYYIRGEQNSPYHTSMLYYFMKDVFLGMRMNAPEKNYFFTIMSNILPPQFSKNFGHLVQNKVLSKEEIINEVDNLLYTNTIAYINFIKYAQVETKELKAGQKLKEVDCKYINETKNNVRILNSTWFTNLVKSDAFKVRGHFRLQAFGEGMKDRKLIWINEFQKSGYTAPARKLSQSGT